MSKKMVDDGGQKNTQKTTQKTVEKTTQKTSEKIIDLIKQNPEISAESISKEIGISSRAVEMQLSKLKEKGLIKRIGPDKGGHWEVLNE
ncbi:MAG: winged helix-turn-helix transcriptional regulator [Nanoarchaeota archaeon]